MATLDDVRTLIEQQGTQFTDFQTRIDRDLDSLGKDLAQLQLAAGRPDQSERLGRSLGVTRALTDALRKAALGDDREIKAMTVGSDPEGGFLVIPAMDNVVRQIRDVVSPLSSLVRTVTLDSGGEFLAPYFRGTLDSGWTGENDTRSETNTVAAGEHRITLHEVYANPKVSQKLLDVANYDIGQLLLDQIAHGLASAEATAFHSGDGVARPYGFASVTTSSSDDASRTWGQVQHIPTTKSGAFASVAPTDALMDTVAALAPQYRPNAKWVMSRTTANAVRKLKDSTGVSLWTPLLMGAQSLELLGFPVVVSDNVPAIAASSLSIWFGDWQQAYTAIRQPGIKLLRDPYTTKGQVFFYAYQRVGGGLVDTNALKCIKFATS